MSDEHTMKVRMRARIDQRNADWDGPRDHMSPQDYMTRIAQCFLDVGAEVLAELKEEAPNMFLNIRPLTLEELSETKPEMSPDLADALLLLVNCHTRADRDHGFIIESRLSADAEDTKKQSYVIAWRTVRKKLGLPT